MTSMTSVTSMIAKTIKIGKNASMAALTLFCGVAFADLDAIPLIRAPKAERQAYIAYTDSQPKYLRYSKWWLIHRIDDSVRHDLENRLGRAQEEFLRGDLLLAFEKFREITELANQYDWRREERGALTHAALRAAQLTSEPSAKKKFVALAAHFEDVQLDSSLYPPPLWSQYQAQKSERSPIQFRGKDWWPDAEFLVVDGHPYEIKKTTSLELDQQVHRFTLVSDSAPPVTAMLTVAGLSSWQPILVPWTDGDCEDHQSRSLTDGLGRAQFFFTEACVLPAALNSTQAPTQAPTQTPTRALTQAASQNSVFDPAPKMAEPVSAFKSENPWWKNRWVWLGTAALGIAVYALQAEHGQNPEPSTSVGF